MRRTLRSLVVVTALLAIPCAARASDACVTRVIGGERGSSWAAPLDRIISVRLANVPLRDALERVARDAGIELSYSNELLPQDQRVCATLTRVPIGAVLETLLANAAVRPIVVAASQIVLAPIRGGSTVRSTLPEQRRASVLDRVVVTGMPDGGSQRASAFALDVIDGTTLSRTSSGTLGDALELAVPGIWAWSTGAGTVAARFGSVRGASSFAVTAPKIYLDGVEVANPLLVTQLQASRIDRIEVIRGPQGAALYGADAISGVINILTRHDGSGAGSARVVGVSTSAGVVNSAFTPNAAFVQQHALSVRGGSARSTYGVGVNAGTVGAYVPGASERNLLADADLRLVGARAVLSTTARLSLQRANAATAPTFGAAGGSPGVRSANGMGTTEMSTFGTRPSYDSIRGFVGDSVVGQDVSQYTVGSSLTMMPSLRWTQTIIAGVDGFRLDGFSSAGLPIAASTAQNPLSGRSAGDRASLRARAVGRFDLAPRTTLAVTMGAENALIRSVSQRLGAADTMNFMADRMTGRGSAGSMDDSTTALPGGRWPPRGDPSIERLTSPGAATTWMNNAGLLAQGNLTWRDAVYLTVGGRVEHTTGAASNSQTALLPMLGATFVRDSRGVVAKARVAFGKGIRPAQNLARESGWIGRTQGTVTALEPESQTGIESGLDVIIGSVAQLHVTRFDQRADGLIQPVPTTGLGVVDGRRVPVTIYSLENIGAITNRGWEFQASAAWRAFTLASAYSLTASRVARVADAYSGELRVGDRMLDVPARTLNLTVGWERARYTLSSTVSRAADWIGYDRVRLGLDLADSERGARQLGGRALRNYWTQYGHVTRVRATAGARLTNQLRLEIIVDNLLDTQQRAADNTTITAGRTIMLGLRTQF